MKNTYNTARTDSSGCVYFDDIQPGQYAFGISREDIPLNWRNYLLEAGIHKEITMTVVPQYDIRVTIHDIEGPPVPNATVSIAGTSNQSTTNENGECTFTNVVMGNLTFNVVCRSFAATRVVKSSETLADNIDQSIFVDIPPPVISINTPQGDFLNYKDLLLSCEAIDALGQPVPDSLIVWEENNLGEIGRGRKIEDIPFRVGDWTLNVTATDIYGFQNKSSRKFSVYYFNPESYFPMSTTGYWEYAYDNPQIVIVYENYTELLIFSDIRVTITNGSQMVTTVGYEIHTEDDVDYADYTVTDRFNVSHDSLLVKSSQEILNRWENPSTGYYFEGKTWIRTNTTYDQPLLIMSNTASPLPGEELSTTCRALISYDLNDTVFTRSFKAYMTTTTISTTGDTEPISVNGKSYETVPVTIHQNETVKRWWLAQGIGILRMEHPLNGATLRADFTEMDIGVTDPEVIPSSPASKLLSPIQNSDVLTVKASAPGLEAHLELLRALIQ